MTAALVDSLNSRVIDVDLYPTSYDDEVCYDSSKLQVYLTIPCKVAKTNKAIQCQAVASHTDESYARGTLSTPKMSDVISSTLSYLPLKNATGWIRLLVIAPPKVGDPETIHCKLHNACLGALPRVSYEALSYTWDDPFPESKPRNDHLIQLNEQPFLIRYNLWSALHHMRLPDEPRTMWVDAICINQTDLSERSQQVAQMQNVYGKAASVVVWLGETSDDSELAYDLLKQAISIAVDEARPKSDSILHPAFYQTHITKTSNRLDLVEAWTKGYRSLAKFFKRSWWSRVWVVQEVVFAREVVVRCGHSKMSWEGLPNAWRLIFGLAKSHLTLISRGDITNTIEYIKNEMEGAEKGAADAARNQNLFRLLHQFRRLNASDARDHVFTISHFGLPLVPIDYNKEPDVIFLETAMVLTSITGDLTILAYVDRTRNRTPHKENGLQALPSWVPNWAEPQLSNTFLGARYNSIIQYQACLCLNAPNGNRTGTWHIKGRQLQTWALRIGRIAMLGIRYPQSGREFCLDACQVAEKSGSIISSIEVFPRVVRTLVANRLRFDRKLADDALEEITAYEDLDEDVRKNVDLMLPGRRFTVLDSGSIGLVPGQAQMGDIVCIIPGCLLPILLRKRGKTTPPIINEYESELGDADFGSHYEMIGPCCK